MRLNKFLSRCGVASRRRADDLIVAGKVSVNNKPIVEKGVIIDEATDLVKVEGQVCRIPGAFVYVMLNKPKDYLVTMDDQFGRKIVADLVCEVGRRVYPVGRLDYDSEGLLILTDDGDLAFRLAHPSYGVKKKYTVGVRGDFQEESLAHFDEGIKLDDGHVAKAGIRILKRSTKFSILSIELSEGRKREIKRMCKAIGYPVTSIRRIQYDCLSLGDLPRGRWRPLTNQEIAKLKRRVGLA